MPPGALRLIKAFGTDDAGQGPPVIVALNKWDVPGCQPRVDRGALKERYPFIREFVKVDSRTPRGIPELKAALCREVEALAWVREPFPASWDRVRRALAGEEEEEPAPAKTGVLEKVRTLFSTPPVKPPKPKRSYIRYAEYRRLCTEKGVAGDGMQDSLAEILHHLGAALNYRKDPRLREATVLQPEWLTNNVYNLMRHAETKQGLLRAADLPVVLKDEPDAEMRAYLVRLMERFEIAYPHKPQDAEPLDSARDHRPLDGTRDERLWLVPQALPDTQPDEAAALAGAPEATRLRYTYPALPEGLVARAIVRLHEFIEEADGHRRQWASGAILVREGARALLRKEPQDRMGCVTFTATSPASIPWRRCSSRGNG
jgi:internalin A